MIPKYPSTILVDIYFLSSLLTDTRILYKIYKKSILRQTKVYYSDF